MNSLKRILSGILAGIMIATAAPLVSAAPQTFTDVGSHWAWTRGYIPYLVEKGVINGYKQPNGTYTFNPDGAVTRAEFIKMLDETFGLVDTKTVSYTDVPENEWFYPYFAKAVAQGYILNYGTKANPNEPISREEATSLLVRYLEVPEDVKFPADTFADYNSISSYYRDNVMKAAGAQLINGYEENGVFLFKPQGTLTRAEALTILYRAAGAIFTTNRASAESGAYEDNAVVKVGNITLQNQNLDGRVIVSEGADNGTVGFYQSKIKDTLYLRGGANITIAASTVKNLVIDSPDQISLSVIEGATIENLIVNERCSIMLSAGTVVKNLTTTDGANLTSVTGSGSVEHAYIQSNNFTSSIVPLEFDIANGLTATFSGTNYEGSSATQESFNNTPFVTVQDGMYRVNVLPLTDGTVRYFYTNSAYCPTISNFDGYYNTALYRDWFRVSANTSETQVTYKESDVKDYKYVVLQLQSGGRYYPPVIIQNVDTSGTGFAVEPYLEKENNIRFTTATSGTVYYMYTDTGTKLNTNEFIVAYRDQAKELKGEAVGSSIRATNVTVNNKYTSVNKYMVFMFKTTGGLYYAPIVVSLGDDGFSSNPSVTTPGTIDFTPSVSGTLYYYYSYNDDLPSSNKFPTAYREAEDTGDMEVTMNRASSLNYKTTLAEEYPYIILCLKTRDGYMQPIAVSIDYNPGFDSLPEVVDESTIRFKSTENGTVYYYYTKSAKAPSAKDFEEIYDDTSARNSGSVKVYGGNYDKIIYDATKAKTYPHMAIMMEDADGTTYQPVVVNLMTTANTGFATTPYIYDDSVYFKTNHDCEVWWYYARTADPVSASEFYEDWNAATFSSSKSVKGGEVSSIIYDRDRLSKYPYLVIATSADEDSDTFTYPYILDMKSDIADTNAAGFKVTRVSDNTVTVTSYARGTLYYYETDESSTPSKSDFEYEYMRANSYYSGRQSVTEGEEGITFTMSGDKDYAMFQIEGENSSGSKVLYDVVRVDLNTKYGGDNGDSDSSDVTKAGYGFQIKDIDTDDRTITVVPEVSGTIHMYLALAGSLMSGNSYTVVAGEEQILTLPQGGTIVGGFEFTLSMQMEDKDGAKYQRYDGISLD